MKHISKILLGVIILTFSTLSSCDLIHEIENAIKKEDTLIIDVNTSVENQRFDIKLEFDSVLSDSRCPIGAECVWAGNAEVRFKLTMDSTDDYQFNLNTNPSFLQDTLIDGLKIKLLDVLPYPNLMIETSYDDYKVKVLVSKD